MALFKRRKRDEPDGDVETDVVDEEDRADEDRGLEAELDGPPAAPAPKVRPEGPWDADDAPEDDIQRLDLGGLLVPVPPGTEVRVDVSNDGTVVAATLVRDGSSVQVNAFAAPRSEGIWPDVAGEILQSLLSSGGRGEQVEGSYGPELHAFVPTQVEGQGVQLAPARFVGVDGPRWFLRALFTGPAAQDAAAAAPLEASLRQVVVVRGTDPMAVRDPLPLRLPADVQTSGEPPAEEPDLTLAERGPEITEVR